MLVCVRRVIVVCALTCAGLVGVTADGMVTAHADTTASGFSVGDAVIAESDAGKVVATVSVTLPAPLTQATTAYYTVRSNEATPNTDFQPRSSKLVFKAGQVAKNLTIVVKGDTTGEPAERVSVVLTRTVGAPTADGIGSVLIRDDDATAVAPVEISAGDSSVSEGDAGTRKVSIPVTLSEPATAPISVRYTTSSDSAIAGSDFVARTGTLKFGIGQQSKTVAVAVRNDETSENAESFALDLGTVTTTASAVVADGEGEGSIVDDESFSAPAIDVSRVNTTSSGATSSCTACKGGSISDDGRYVAFMSEASDLVTGDTNGVADVFVKDRTTGAVERVSVTTGGGQLAASSWTTYTMLAGISGNGRFVGFISNSPTFGVPMWFNGAFVHDRVAGTTERLDVPIGGGQPDKQSFEMALSDDAQRIAFQSHSNNLVAGDTDDAADVFLYDRTTGVRTLVSAGIGGAPAIGFNPGVSGDGSTVAFESNSPTLVADDTNGIVDVFTYDVASGTIERVNVADDESEALGFDTWNNGMSLSDDGNLVTFTSEAWNLLPGGTAPSGRTPTQVYVRDRAAGTTERVSNDADGTAMNGRARFGSISGDGRYVSFTATMADVDLMGPPCPSLFCGLNEVFRYDRVTQTTLRTSWPLFGGFPDDSSETQYIMHSAISDDGSSVVYTSYASNFIAGDTVGSPDIFVTDYL